MLNDPYALVLTDLVVSGEPDADGRRDAAVLVGQYCRVPCSTSEPPTVTATGPDGTVYEGSRQRAEFDVEVGSSLVDYYIWRAWLPPLSDGELYTVRYADLAMTEASVEAAFDGAQVSSVTAPVNDETSQAYCCLPGTGTCETESSCIYEGQYERQALKVQLPTRPGFVFRWKQRSADWSDSEYLDGAIQVLPETVESDSNGEYCAELEALTLHGNVIESEVFCAPANPDAGTLRPVSHEEIDGWWCPEDTEFVPAITEEASDFADLVQCESCLEPDSCPIPAERCEALRELYPAWETTELLSEPPQEPATPDAEGADDTAVVEEPASDDNSAPSDGAPAPAVEGDPADALDGAPEVTTEVAGSDPADESPPESGGESADVSSADDEAAPEEVGVAEEPSGGGSDGELDVAPSAMSTNASPKQDSNEATSELSTEAELQGVDTASDSGCRLSGKPVGSPWSCAAWLPALVFALWRRRA